MSLSWFIVCSVVVLVAGMVMMLLFCVFNCGVVWCSFLCFLCLCWCCVCVFGVLVLFVFGVLLLCGLCLFVSVGLCVSCRVGCGVL